jgi:subtilisin family serine protease
VAHARRFLAAAAVTSALIPAGPAAAIDLSLRSPYLPPTDGSATAEAFSLASQGHELIVAVERGEHATRILRSLGARPLGEQLWLVGGGRSATAVRRLDAIGALRYAHENGRLERSGPLVSASDPLDPAPWWMPQIGADRVTPPGAGFPLTVVDDGLDMTHPEFVARQVRFVNGNDLVPDVDFHGTMVSSVAAAPQNGTGIVGLYPRATLRSADTGYGTCADVLAAVEAVIAAGPSVINMSWGFSPPRCLALHDLLTRAVAAGSLPVSATGNMRLHLSPPGVPAMWPHVLTAGSTSPRERVSYFSTEGSGIDLAAPGESMLVATPVFFDPSGYVDVEGTSFSAALVSAAAAWVATRRRMHVTQLFELLRSSARDIGDAGWDVDTGFGILDLPAALTRRLPAVDPLEPNDDVNQVRPGGIFKQPSAALTRPGRARATLRARLDRSEDPVDVYRLYVPSRRTLKLRVVPTSNVDFELFRPNAASCYYHSRQQARRGGALIGGRYAGGPRAEAYSFENRREQGRYVYACVYKPRDASLTANYSLSIDTVRLGGLPGRDVGKDAATNRRTERLTRQRGSLD